jgi:hypothetical protein
MRFSEIENIWDVDVTHLSNADRGRVFVERAKQVVADCFADRTRLAQAVRAGRFRREYLIDHIHCSPAVASQNPKIKKLLADTDALLVLGGGEATPRPPSGRAAEKSIEAKDGLRNRVQHKQRRDGDAVGRIIFSASDCVSGTKHAGIPHHRLARRNRCRGK